jgi:uncharacterized protein YoxC
MTLTISVAVIAAIMVIVGVVAIIALFYLIRLLKATTNLIETVKPQIVPVSHDIARFSQKTQQILDSVVRQVHTVEESVNTVKDVTMRVKHFEENLLLNITKPLVNSVAYVGAIAKGVQVFVKMLRK